MAGQRKKLNEKNQRLKSVPDKLIKKLKDVQAGSYNLIIAGLKLETVGDFIKSSEENFLAVDELQDRLKNYLLTGDYKEAVAEYAGEFEAQKTFNKDYFDSILEEGEKYSLEVADNIVSRIKKHTVNALLQDSLRKDFLTPLQSVLDKAVAAEASFKETVSFIRTFVEGNEEIDGGILRYAKQLAHDNFANADRAYSNAIADDLEGEWFVWSGEAIESTRCFCYERKNKYFHYKEIEAWGRGENVGKCGFPWAGMNRDTNEKTIFIYGGGHGCLDSLMMSSIFDVPPEDVKRNVDNGNYEPSEYEREFFNL